MSFPRDKCDRLQVGLQFSQDTAAIPVGTLAFVKEARGQKIYFQYDASFLSSGLRLSPVHLPLEAKLFTFTNPAFENLPGVFDDSLPDGWGRLLCDRFVRRHSVDPAAISPLDRLAYVGKTAMGALVYEPAYENDEAEEKLDLNRLAEEANAVLTGSSDAVLRELLALNGSSAGARPKALIGVDKDHKEIIGKAHEMPEGFTPWLVKFSNTQDGNDAGAIEYVYALMAKQAGLVMPETWLFPAERGAGFFAVKRFDREKQQRLHMHTASGLLHADFRASSLDYQDLMKLTHYITRDIREVEKLYRMAVFNVLAHNRDDHGKNFSFLMNEAGEWRLAPAYDLTFSSGPGGEQSTMVLGEGKKPDENTLLKLASGFKLPAKNCRETIERVKNALANWPHLAAHYGVSRANIAHIGAKLQVK